MTLLSYTNIKILAVTISGALIAYRLYWEVTTGAARRSLAKQHGCLPAKRRPTKYPFLFGLEHFSINIKAFRNHKLLETEAQLLRDNNTHTILSRVLGRLIYLTDDPENVKAMLATDFDSWSLGEERIKNMSSYLGHGIFTNEGAAWKHSREMLRPCFERSQVADLSIMDTHVQHLIDQVPTDGTTVDLQPLFHELTLDVATEFLFGRSTNALDHSREDRACQEFIEAFEYCQSPFSKNKKGTFGLILSLFLPDKKFKKYAKIIQGTLNPLHPQPTYSYHTPDFADKIIDEETTSSPPPHKDPTNPSRYIFLPTLLLSTPHHPTIRSELLNILLAARDTTASLLSNLLWELSRQPPLLSRLRLEIASQIGSNPPTYADLKSLRYLRALINEAQRMYPIVPTNARQALHDNVLPRGGGPDGQSPVLVPKGTYVAYHSWSMHRREDVYGSDAHVFEPGRWLDEGREGGPLRPGWAYIPFSGGPRSCIGQGFALTECMYVVVRLVQEFEIEGRDEEVWREALGITCVGFGGCKVGLRRKG